MQRAEKMTDLGLQQSVVQARSTYIGLLIGIDSSDMNTQTRRTLRMQVEY